MADTLWVMVAGMLVFFMNLGFGCVESGFCRAKNCVNILSKNFIVFAATSIGFLIVGWGLMFGDGNDFFGTKGLFMVGGPDNSPQTTSLSAQIKTDITEQYKDVDLADAKYAPLVDKIDEMGRQSYPKDSQIPVTLEVPGAGSFSKEYPANDYYWGVYSSIMWAGVPLWAKFFFQLVFAGTAATIVSGAVAERIKYHSFIIFTFIMAVAIYPIVGHMIWGGGLLSAGKLFGDGKALFDFAGSTVVHSTGGWAALAGAIVLGPRIGKYVNGKVNAIPGHNLTAAFIGCLVLWFGWFGFNPGSTMAVDPGAIARVAVTTNTAAAMGVLTATLTAWILLGKPDLGMTLNGCLAGLVAITAPCAFVSVPSSAVIGAIAGVIVVLSVLFFDRIRVDDPVGAISVHLVNGVFGTICVGLFGLQELGLPADGLLMGGGTEALIPQLVGPAIIAAYVFPVSLVSWFVLKLTLGIRVGEEEEIEGLDIGEHGNEAYHGFVMAAADHGYVAQPLPASVPPDSKRFTVVVDGVDNGNLIHAWSDLCQPSSGPPADEFKAVYPYVTTVQKNRFRFRGGDPEVIKKNLETLLRRSMKESNAIRVYTED
ncbi:MAG: ammonium transporter [Gemmataceae bacterium]